VKSAKPDKLIVIDAASRSIKATFEKQGSVKLPDCADQSLASLRVIHSR
jgi:hypothetical protein